MLQKSSDSEIKRVESLKSLFSVLDEAYSKAFSITNFIDIDQDLYWAKAAKCYNLTGIHIITPDLWRTHPSEISPFLKKYGTVMAAPLRFLDCSFGYELRPASKIKDFRRVSRAAVNFYMAESSNAFLQNKSVSFGQPWVLSEGILDAEVLASYTADVSAACLTSVVSATFAKFLSLFTDKVAIVFDSDYAGKEGASRSKAILQKVGIKGEIFRLPMFLKDPGDLLKIISPSETQIMQWQAFTANLYNYLSC